MSAHFPPADFSEGDVRWWVESFGGHIPVDVRPTAWVARHGLPSGLHELVASLQP